MQSNDKHDWHVATWWAQQCGWTDQSEWRMRTALDLRDECLTTIDRYQNIFYGRRSHD